MGLGGLIHISDDFGILASFNPVHAVQFMMREGYLGIVVLGAVFLTVTGAEALYADLGHFGRRPIQWAWFTLVFPALSLNYLGQGADRKSVVWGRRVSVRVDLGGRRYL